MSPLEKQLIRHEGEQLHPYTCPGGYLTIGIGHNLDANGITPDVSRHIFRIDLARARDDVRALLEYYRIRSWTMIAARYDVLVNMAFCMGRPALGGFRKMFEAISKSNWEEASAEIIDSAFCRSKLHHARAMELAKQMETGEYQ